jgi:hypothetical protein
VVAEDFPWPPSGGGHLRLAQVIEVVADLGEPADASPASYPLGWRPFG